MRSPSSDQRPSADGGATRRLRKRAAARRRLARPALVRARERAQRVERVVGDRALPHQIPQRVDGLAREAAAGRLVQRGEERRAVLAEVIDDGLLARLEVGKDGGAPQPREGVGEVQREPAVAIAERLDAAPDDFAGGGQRVEIGGVVALDARREDLALEDRRRQRRALQVLDRIEQRVEAGAPPDDALPGGEEAREDRAGRPARPACAASPASGGGSTAGRRGRTTRGPCRRAGTLLRAAGPHARAPSASLPPVSGRARSGPRTPPS